MTEKTKNSKMIPAIVDVMQERAKQITKGFDGLHDDQYDKGPFAGPLVQAAICYADPKCCDDSLTEVGAPVIWPWDDRWWRPETTRRNLVKAAALLVAEIERIDRKEARKAVQEEALDRMVEENQKLGLYDDETPKNN